MNEIFYVIYEKNYIWEGVLFYPVVLPVSISLESTFDELKKVALNKLGSCSVFLITFAR